jgi:uncharacterized protein YkwD
VPSASAMYRRDRCVCPSSRRTARRLRSLLLVASVFGVPGVPGVAGATTGPAHKTRPGRHVAHRRSHRRPGRPTVKAPPAPAPAPAACPYYADLAPGGSNLPTIAHATICLIDRERAQRGLSGLRENAALDRTAAGHSADMIAAGYFDHTGPKGDTAVSRILASGYMTGCSGCALGENIGVGGTGSSTPAEMVAMWMADPPHRANILDPAFRDVGVGAVDAMPAVVGGGPGATYTADFARAGP